MTNDKSTHAREVKKGARFEFGANWSRFLSMLDEERISAAEQSLQTMLGTPDLAGKRFLDIGSGSGLFSLAARRLQATVHSIDYDPQSVACTMELKERYFPADDRWQIEQGSALDPIYLAQIGQFDVVYSWGVLHHTGAMWLGIEYALQRVADGGQLFIAIYNDQGWKSRAWWLIKNLYNRLPKTLKPIYTYVTWYSIIGLKVFLNTLMLRPGAAIQPFLNAKPRRGMSKKHDLIDWIGGFPFEYAKFDLLIDYLNARGFSLLNGIPNNGSGCHELVFNRLPDPGKQKAL